MKPQLNTCTPEEHRESPGGDGVSPGGDGVSLGRGALSTLHARAVLPQ